MHAFNIYVYPYRSIAQELPGHWFMTYCVMFMCNCAIAIVCSYVLWNLQEKNITHWLGNKLAHACHFTAPEIKIIIVLCCSGQAPA